MTTVGCLLTKVIKRFGCQHHDANGNDDRDHHDLEIFHHTHGCDDAIERENGIEDNDLRNDLPEHRMRHIAFLGGHMAFQPLMQLHRAFEQQEDAAENEDDIASGEIEASDVEQRRGQLITHEMEASSSRRMISASERPTSRARLR